MTTRIAVLASGTGSNLLAILNYLGALGDARSGEIVLVISDRALSPALAHAAERGIECRHIVASDAEALLGLLTARDVGLVVLAGYLALVPPAVTSRFAGRIINVHPALLPRFGGRGMYGRRVHEAVLASAADHTGLTVHFVDDEYDHGAVIAQWRVPVCPGDDADTLARRVLDAEHLVYPRVVDMVAAAIAQIPYPDNS